MSDPSQNNNALLESMKSNPWLAAIVALTVLSGGSDYVFSHQTSGAVTDSIASLSESVAQLNSEVTVLSNRVDQALDEITDNSQRIARTENKIDLIEDRLLQIGYVIRYGGDLDERNEEER